MLPLPLEDDQPRIALFRKDRHTPIPTSHDGSDESPPSWDHFAPDVRSRPWPESAGVEGARGPRKSAVVGKCRAEAAIVAEVDHWLGRNSVEGLAQILVVIRPDRRCGSTCALPVPGVREPPPWFGSADPGMALL
jgi:hypothetical protein